jgi:hypothetical protein
VAEAHPECTNPGRFFSFEAAGAIADGGAARNDDKLCVLRHYRYALVLENTREPDYVTEKVYHALLVGAVPLFEGAPNAAAFVPTPTSFVPLDALAAAPASPKRQQTGDGRSEVDMRSRPQALNVTAVKEWMDHLEAQARAIEKGTAGIGQRAAGTGPSKVVPLSERFSFAALMGWRAARDVTTMWSDAFRANLMHREPTCDICREALQRRCQQRHGNGTQPR